jgi:hypothetical protein
MKPNTNKHRLYNALKRLVTEAHVLAGIEQDVLPETHVPDDALLCVIPLSALEQARAALSAARLNRRDPDAA